MRSRLTALGFVAVLVVLAGCGDKSKSSDNAAGAQTQTVRTTRVEVVKGLGAGGAFDPTSIYRRESEGVVTVISTFDGSGGSLLGSGSGPQRGLGSGFVISASGEIATNAHVVSDTQGSKLKQAKSVYVKFGDGNQVPAKVVGTDPNADVALLRIAPKGLTLRPLELGSSAHLVVGAPVAAIGSPFGEPQSLSVGVISATKRSIDSLTKFQIADAIQTDAAINHGNSGGPLVDARGRVVGINSQIQSTGGGGEGVGFAVPIDTVRRSLSQLRSGGKVSYAYIGLATIPLFPQLAERFHLPVAHGAYIQTVTSGGPAEKAKLKAGSKTERFDDQPFRIGGDIITSVDGTPIRDELDLGRAIADRRADETVKIVLYRDGKKRTISVKLAERPPSVSQAQQP